MDHVAAVTWVCDGGIAARERGREGGIDYGEMGARGTEAWMNGD